MNTPAHVVAGLWAVGRSEAGWRPALAGAAFPDAPMLLFYAWERGWIGRTESEIWSTTYFDPGWQAFFDAFHSIPAVALGLGLAYWLQSPWWRVFFWSMGIHCVADLLLHHDDGHRHFLPLSDWRFESPLSYWDPAHYGILIGTVEAVATLVGAALLLRATEARGVRATAAVLLVSFGGLAAFALTFWVNA